MKYITYPIKLIFAIILAPVFLLIWFILKVYYIDQDL